MNRYALITFSLFILAAQWAFAQVNAVGYATVTFPPEFSAFSNPLNATDNSVVALFKVGTPEIPEGTVIYRLSSNPSPGLPESANPTGFGELIAKLPAEFQGPVSIGTETGNIILEWSGRLQTAAEITGPYETVSELAGSLRFLPSVPRSFWRARITAPLSFSQFTANVYEAGEWSVPSDILAPGDGAIIFNPSDKPITLTFVGQVLQGKLSNPIPAGWSIRSSMAPINGGITAKAGLELSAGDRLFFLEGGRFNEFAHTAQGGWVPTEPQNITAKAFFIFASKARTWEKAFKP